MVVIKKMYYFVQYLFVCVYVCVHTSLYVYVGNIEFGL